MKQLLFLLPILLGSYSALGQISNGSFENGGNPDLSNWEWTCSAVSDSSTPPGGGDWSIKVASGNTQGCFPGYAYQKLPTITNGQTFQLSCWLFGESVNGFANGAGVYFGKINGGVISLLSGTSTSSSTWTSLSLQSSFSLSAGDTAIVVLYGGLTSGPVQGHAYFDLINLQQVAGLASLDQNPVMKLYPNPFKDETTLQTEQTFQNATLTMSNAFGEIVHRRENINGSSIVLERDNLPNGVYYIQVTEESRTTTLKLSIVD